MDSKLANPAPLGLLFAFASTTLAAGSLVNVGPTCVEKAGASTAPAWHFSGPRVRAPPRFSVALLFQQASAGNTCRRGSCRRLRRPFWLPFVAPTRICFFCRAAAQRCQAWCLPRVGCNVPTRMGVFTLYMWIASSSAQHRAAAGFPDVMGHVLPARGRTICLAPRWRTLSRRVPRAGVRRFGRLSVGGGSHQSRDIEVAALCCRLSARVRA